MRVKELMKKYVALVLCLGAAGAGASACSQEEEGVYDESAVSHEPAPGEARFARSGALTAKTTLPVCPAQPVKPRMIAEWEPMKGALIRFPLGISLDFVAQISDESQVFVLADAGQVGKAERAFARAGVNLDHVSFIEGPTDTYWTRDYAPWWIVEGEAHQRVVRAVDPIYYDDRQNDDLAPVKIAEYLGQPCYRPIGITIQGGNMMADGLGVGASTKRVYKQNPDLTPAAIALLAKEIVGFDPYHVIDDSTGTYIEHIDTWAKFISETKILIRRVPQDHPQYQATEAAVRTFAGIKNGAKQPFEVFRVDSPNNEPFTNHLVLNNRVFVPVWDGEDKSKIDKAGLDQIRAAYGPGYRVFGVLPGKQDWLSTDSLHCRVNAIPDLEKIDN